MAPETNSLTQACLDAGKVSPEISQVLQVISGHPSADGYNALGVCSRNGATLAARFPLLRLPFVSTRMLRRHVLIWRSLVRMGKKEQGVENSRLLISQQPYSFVAHKALGLVLDDLGDLAEAAEEFKAALTMNPRFALAASNLAHLLHGQKRYQACTGKRDIKRRFSIFARLWLLRRLNI